MIFLTVLFICSLNFLEIFGSFQIGRPGGIQVSIDRFDGTCRGHRVPIIFNYNGFRTEDTKLWLNSTISSKEDVNNEPWLSIRIQKCGNRENLDTCEEFHRYRIDEYCSLLESGNELWSSFFGGYTPQWKCPIKKTVYKRLDHKWDLSPLLLFPMDNWIWKVTAELREKNSDRLLMCLLSEARVISK